AAWLPGRQSGRGGEASSLCGNRWVPANGTQSAVGPAVGSSTGTQLHPAESLPESRLMTGPKWWRHSALIREYPASTCAGSAWGGKGSFDDLVGAGENRGRHYDADRLGGNEVDR